MLCFAALPAAGKGAEEEASGPPPPGNAGPPPPSPGTERPKSPPARDFCSALCPALGKAKGTQTDHHQGQGVKCLEVGEAQLRLPAPALSVPSAELAPARPLAAQD